MTAPVERVPAPKRERGVAASCLHTFVFAALPLASVVAGNVEHYPINIAIVIRALAIIAAGTAAILWLLRYLGWSLGARAAWLSVFLIVVNAYYLIPVPSAFGRRLDDGTTAFAVAYLAACAVLATAAIRPWRRKRRDPVPLTFLALAWLVSTVAGPTVRTLSRERGWEEEANALIAPSFQRRGQTGPERDVYVIVMDGLGRADVIRDYYGLDLSHFVASLEAKGFSVPARSRSNYSQTFLAISSMLNIRYLDGIAKTLGPDSRNRLPLKYAIERNALMTLARQAGYTVVGIASDYPATESFPLAQVCFCDLPNPHEFDHTVIRRSPLADLGRERWIAAGRRRRVLESFDALEQASGRPGRKFVVAHLITPHPPFVFDREGRPRTPPADVPFVHGEWLTDRVRSRPEFSEEYARGYAEQADFVSRRLAPLIDRLLSRPGPRPAIMIVGDHGPALELNPEDQTRTNMRERMTVFSAYHLPGDEGRALYPEISPVNGARAVADRYLGVDVPFLPEQTQYSTFVRPYELTAVPPEGAADVAGAFRRPSD